jgi:hypothetical protein
MAQKTYIARKGQDADFANVTASGTLAVTGAVTQTGAAQFNSTVTVGVDDTGYDVKFFGATASKYWLWDESADKVILVGDSQFTGGVVVGVDDTGHDVQFFGATSGKVWLWDESADTMIVTGDSQFTGTLTVGVDDTGHDVQFFGATAGVYWMWDESADVLLRDGGSLLVKAVASGDAGMTVSADGMTADPETAQEAGYIAVDIGGTGYQIPIYAA